MNSTALASKNDVFSQLYTSVEEVNNTSVINSVEGNIAKADIKDISFFRITGLSFDKDYPHREAFENVISSLNDPAFNFVYILAGTKNGVELYLGAAKNGLYETNIHASEYTDRIRSAVNGNFSGSIMSGNLKKEELDSLIYDTKRLKRSGAVLGIPSLNKENDKNEDFQGIDRLINNMQGRGERTEWRMVIVCRPLEKNRISDIKEYIYNLYNSLYIQSKCTIQISNGESHSENHSESSGYNRSKTTGSNDSHSKGTTNSTENNSHSWGTSDSKTEGTSESHSDGKTDGINSGKAFTTEYVNKQAQEILKYIDEELLERFKQGFSKGMFDTSVYYMAQNDNDRKILKSAILSLFQGDKSTMSPLVACDFSDEETELAQNVIFSLNNQYITDRHGTEEISVLLSRNIGSGKIGLSTLLIPKEIALVAGLPQREVIGLKLKQAVEFGLNVKDKKYGNASDDIILGNVIQRGRVLMNQKFSIPLNTLSKHIFIGGVTGSGKTVTCQKLLFESKLPFLVIEPAKTEYRSFLQGVCNDVIVFTVGNETCDPLRLNPFELIEGENIASHIDMVRATFTAAFPMEASMPQILEEAIYSLYEKKGWDISDNSNIYSDDPYSDCRYFPTMSELVRELPEIVKKKEFGERLQSEYIGSIVSRISNLTVGAKGYMLDCVRSIDFEKLIDKRVIIEMEELKAPEDKALMMGFVLSRLSCVIRKRYGKDKQFRHITLVEESHRLLSKCDFSDNGAKKNSVDMFTDMLAEVRKYGESLVIVDQIPNKLSPEVMKNTNTKIIHKLFAMDDKETVGNTMLMNEEQQAYLSSLEVGEAIVFTESTDKPVHIKINNRTSKGEITTDKEELTNDEVKKMCEARIKDLQLIIPGYKKFERLLKDVCAALSKNDDEAGYEKIKSLTAFLKDTSDKYNISEKRVWDEWTTMIACRSGSITKAAQMKEVGDNINRAYSDILEMDIEALKDNQGIKMITK